MGDFLKKFLFPVFWFNHGNTQYIVERKFFGAGSCDRRNKQRSAPKGRRKIASTKDIGHTVKESNYKSYDELPLFLNAAVVVKVLGISPSSGYELMHESDLPVLKIGSRMVVPKEKFVEWESRYTQGGVLIISRVVTPTL